MKKLIYILLFLPSSLLGQSAMEPLSNMERLERDFGRNRLNQSQLEAFSLRAEQKLKDFCEYTLVLADTAYPAEMLDHLEGMARASFGEDAGQVLGMSLEAYFTALRNAQLPPFQIEPNSFAWQQKLGTTSKKKQLGRLAFRDERGKTYEAAISLQYLPKKFGKEKQYVWTLFLEGIEEI
ncbi:MAG: hypothetical protein AAF927_01065 [Bacteroidota bacterium]